ncbi:helix-hairpin-helix domain-containing protein [Streptomyces atratus]|uniref:hypothetical protein n=1 Tax=Streptomyces atratus TaxID=1893 RepID=UPI003656F2F0
MTEGQAGQEAACDLCRGGELFDLFGHDREGHRVTFALARERISIIDQLKSMSEEELLKVRGIGAVGLSLIRERLKEGGGLNETLHQRQVQ